MKWVVLASLVACTHTVVTPRSPAIVITHADVLTMDPAHPHASMIAYTRDGTIVAVGDGPFHDASFLVEKEIDAHGATITPGWIDAHCHLFELGADSVVVDLRGATDAIDAATELAAGKVIDGWLHGAGWDQNKWPAKQFPTKAQLDAVTRDTPAVAERIDGHASWANSAALALAGITRATKDPAGGQIVRDAKGDPTGVLIDNAQALVLGKLPQPAPELRARWIEAAAQIAVAAGITGVHEMGISDDTAAVYKDLAAHDKLPLRVYAFLRGDPDHPAALHDRHPEPATGHFQMRGVKFFVDGALGSRGARLKQPYADDPKNVGLWVTEPAALTKAIDAAVGGGWDIAVHAIGDAGVAAVIDAFLVARQDHPGTKVKLRIEHTQIIAPEDVARMKQADAIASMQPTHATSDMAWAEQRLGPVRLEGAYAWRTILAAKIPLIGGSDFPVEEVGPLLGIYAAVTRQDAAGNPAGGWYPAQRMTLDEAIAAFTRDAAAAEHVTDRGVIAVGKRADFTVLDGKLTPDASMLTKHVWMTIVDGKTVYERGAR